MTMIVTRWCRFCQNVLKPEEHGACTLCDTAKARIIRRVIETVAPTFACRACGIAYYNEHPSGLCYQCGKGAIGTGRRRFRQTWRSA